jgi:hypothetical protein
MYDKPKVPATEGTSARKGSCARTLRAVVPSAKQDGDMYGGFEISMSQLAPKMGSLMSLEVRLPMISLNGGIPLNGESNMSACLNRTSVLARSDKLPSLILWTRLFRANLVARELISTPSIIRFWNVEARTACSNRDMQPVPLQRSKMRNGGFFDICSDAAVSRAFKIKSAV